MLLTDALPNLTPPVARLTFHALVSALPPPVTDSPEDRAARDEAAVAAVAALYPADAFEARLAARIVATDAHAMDCLRLAVEPGIDPQDVRRRYAQASSMMRQSQSALYALQQRQAAREKVEAALHPAAMERAGYWFHDVSVPAHDEAPPPVPAEPDPPADIAAEADQYAVIYPDRAACIRANRGLPQKLDFGPPAPELLHAIVTGTTPILRALDTQAPSSPPPEPPCPAF